MTDKLLLVSGEWLALVDDDGDDLLLAAAGNITIALGSPARTPVVYGPVVTQSDVSTADVIVRLFHEDDLVVPAAELEAARAIRWREQLNDEGTASLVLQNDDPKLALIGVGDVIRFEVFGFAAFTWLARDRERVSISPDEEAGQATTLSGPGILALLDEALVYPARGVGSQPVEEDRMFNWTSVDFDDSSWVDAKVMAIQSATNGGVNTAVGWVGQPAGWVDPPGYWIWANTEDFITSQSGFCYLRGTFYAPSDCRVIAYATCDNGGDLYVDGIPVIPNMNDFTRIFEAEIDVTTGDHTVAVSCGNTPDPGNPLNPGGVLLAVFVLNTDRSLGSRLLHSDAGFVIIEFPGYAPGMTVGEVLRHCVEEAQTRGALVGVTLMFDDDTDSDGEPWTESADIATKVGTDLLTFVKELETYCDVWMAPTGLELYAWRKGGRGATRAVSYHPPTSTDDPTTGNLRSLTHKRAD